MYANFALALALFVLTSQALPASNNTNTPNPTNPFSDPSNCALATSFQTANASFSYNIPSVNYSNHIITSQDPLHTKNWTLSTTIYQSPADGRFRTNQDFWLDTSSSLSPNSSEVSWSGCVTVFKGLAQSISERGQDDNGSCSSLLGKECASALQAQFKGASYAVSYADRRQSGAEACMSVAGAAMMMPAACRSKIGVGKDDGWGLAMSSEIPNFTPLSTSNCSSTSPTSPRRILGTSSTLVLPASNLSVYDQWVSSVTPVMLSMWSNSTADGQIQPWADTRLVCARPKNIAGGSRMPAPVESSKGSAPTGTKSGSGKVSVGRGGWAGLALGVVAVWMVVWV